jgi:hypothetical protein
MVIMQFQILKIVDGLSKMEKINSFLVGQRNRIDLKRHHEIEIGTKNAVFYIPFRSNAYYFTHPMWIDESKLIFESLLEQTNSYENYVNMTSIIFMVDFEGLNPENPTVNITRLTPPSENALFFQTVLDKDNQILYYFTEKKLMALNLCKPVESAEYLTSVLDLEENHISQTLCGITLTCDKNNLIFSTMKKSKEDKPNGFIYKFNLSNHQFEVLEKFEKPWIKNHFLASPTDPNYVTYALTKETEYPKTMEWSPRIWSLELKDYTQKPVYIHKKTGLFRKPEIVTHEAWVQDGESLTFIVRRKKIKIVDIQTGISKTIMKFGANPWHCDPRNGVYFVFDTMNANTGIWMGKIKDQTWYKNICRTSFAPDNQAYHPHPFLSPHNKWILFNCEKEKEGYLHIAFTGL